MRRSAYMPAFVFLVVTALLLSPGCGGKPPLIDQDNIPVAKKTSPPKPKPPAPTIELKVSPTAIEKGESTTLTWNSTNAPVGVIIDNNVGTVEASGSRKIHPSVSTTYKATATGEGGNAVAEARVTVEQPSVVTPTDFPGSDVIDIDRPDFTRDTKDVFFNYDQYVIRADDLEALKRDVNILKALPKVMIRIEGHCDERGSDKYNLALGDRRAIAVRDYLINQGIDSSRIETISYGKERPFCEESNEECWQLNRRAHFVQR